MKVAFVHLIVKADIIIRTCENKIIYKIESNLIAMKKLLRKNLIFSLWK